MTNVQIAKELVKVECPSCHKAVGFSWRHAELYRAAWRYDEHRRADHTSKVRRCYYSGCRVKALEGVSAPRRTP